ncbi:MAG TPA: hypothetical protein VK395_20905 [Gemmataceae bacterium]|nr:hypothetical protein [Gemmataceae bacterium]
MISRLVYLQIRADRPATRLLCSLGAGRHHLDEEAKLILESVNTDIGVGD